MMHFGVPAPDREILSVQPVCDRLSVCCREWLQQKKVYVPRPLDEEAVTA